MRKLYGKSTIFPNDCGDCDCGNVATGVWEYAFPTNYTYNFFSIVYLHLRIVQTVQEMWILTTMNSSK